MTMLIPISLLNLSLPDSLDFGIVRYTPNTFKHDS